ncbi:MAG: NTP transferase domain-containing protein [Flavobacteriales bacterium]|nr:NTP transferase domain-containing protein [Flavobacteriales bacterium]MCB9449570.1 NTP transferase domain-containing protein [Flavobacteriales bacterium]
MRIVIPMAGMGKRMRPHTLTVPKPLLPVAGKPIVQWLVEDLVAMCHEKVEEVAFVIGDFGKDVENALVAIAEKHGAKGTIHYQEEALGTGHAILCAEPALKDKVIVAFADTLFMSDFDLDESKDGVIWVHKVEDPRPFGVVKLSDKGLITDFVEKPETFVSDLAIIGIYYFKDGERLRQELQYLIDNNVRDKGEYQLTSALENMRAKGAAFAPGRVSQWLDCGNKDATVDTNKSMLERFKDSALVSEDVQVENGLILAPSYVGKGVVIRNSIVGPHASIGDQTVLEDVVIRDSIVQQNSRIRGLVIEHSMIGNHVSLDQPPADMSVGDYTTVKSKG